MKNFKNPLKPEPMIDKKKHESANPEQAASLVEYALLIALIALVCVAAITILGQATSNKFSSMATGLENAAS